MEPALAASPVVSPRSRLNRAQYIESHAIPALKSKTIVLSSLLLDNSIKEEHLLMVGCISSFSTDILSHADPEHALHGLRQDPEYMVQLERQHQYGDRCLYACVMVRDRIATCKGLLAQRISQYACLICVLGKETEGALEEEEKILDLFKKGSDDVAKANEALEDALKADREEVRKSPWGC